MVDHSINTPEQSISPPKGLETNEVPSETSPVIEPSAALEMYIPAIDVHAQFDDGACRVVDGAANEHKVSIGDKLYVRTKNSDQNWLTYTATDLHGPDKQGLAGDSSVWGDEATPGRLLTISCIQPANPLKAAVRNAVVGWQFEGTTRAADDKA